MRDDFADPNNFINRELSWLEFNRRVLEEAQDRSQPLMERVKFLSIFSSNLDEFFEIRVAGIKQQIDSGTADIGPDGMTPAEVFEAIEKRTHEMVAEIYRLWNEDIEPALALNGVHILKAAALLGADAEWAQQFFRKEVFPVLTPLAVDSSHPFPQVLNKSHNLIVRARKPGNEDPLYAVVQVPRVIPRFIPLPREKQEHEPWDYIYLAALIKVHISELFPGLELEDVHAFRITRNSDLYIDEEEAENLLRTIEQELRRSSRGNVVRLEVEADCPKEFQDWLVERFKLKQEDVYKVAGPLTMTHLLPLIGNEAFAMLKDRPFTPAYDPDLPPHGDVWQLMRQEDVLLHHPYESFDSIVDLVETAAKDPQVLAIKMTLYRTSGDSAIVKALINAAQNGKQVVLVELKARFDEANNIHWARMLEEAGAHVVYGLVGLKTHCKALLIVRRDDDGIRHYAHLGTGNYHPRTARIYTDLSLFTTNRDLTQELAALFNTLTGLAAYPGFKHLMVAPFDLVRRVRELIERERDLARAGRPGRIIVKINSLVDEHIIKALYEASCAGVQIDLIIRGICCLRPGIPGVSENIRVISIVGRFLEHSRIYYFANDGDPSVYLASADWMPRNFYRRVEVAFPIESPKLREEVINVILPAFLNDRVKARELLPDGRYMRLKPRPGEEHSQAQLFFRERSRKFFASLAKATSHAAAKLVPIEMPPEAVELGKR